MVACSEKTMKHIVRENIIVPYSLHDMNVIAFDVEADDIIMRTQSGMVKTTEPMGQPEGYVVFHNVQWDYSYAYLLEFTGNVGRFSGEKMFLKDFITNIKPFGYCIMDEHYGYNSTKYTGYLISKRQHHECMLEIYHEGDMVFVAEE